MTSRSSFLAQRKLGIGGSDIASLFNVGYGCRRRLFYDKTNTPEDFPRDSSLIMELGNVLEPWFAERYAKETGRHTSLSSVSALPELPQLRVNVDRMVWRAPTHSPGGVLEIKSTGRSAFYKYKREGLPEDYILQLQAGMLASGLSWGSFAIGCRDSGELLHWDVERNVALCNEIAAEVPGFWETVEAEEQVRSINRSMMTVIHVDDPPALAPPRLEPDDRRCQSCEFRRTCQGNALIQLEGDGEKKPMPELLPILAEYDERKGLFDMAEELLDETKAQLKDKLGDNQAAIVGKRPVYYRQSAGKTKIDGKGLLEAYGIALSKLQSLRVIDEVDEEMEMVSFPAPESFVETGKPYRTLRIY